MNSLSCQHFFIYVFIEKQEKKDLRIVLKYIPLPPIYFLQFWALSKCQMQ